LTLLLTATQPSKHETTLAYVPACTMCAE